MTRVATGSRSSGSASRPRASHRPRSWSSMSSRRAGSTVRGPIRRECGSSRPRVDPVHPAGSAPGRPSLPARLAEVDRKECESAPRRAPAVPRLPARRVPVAAVRDGRVVTEEVLVRPDDDVRRSRPDDLVAAGAAVRLLRARDAADAPLRPVRPALGARHPTKGGLDVGRSSGCPSPYGRRRERREDGIPPLSPTARPSAATPGAGGHAKASGAWRRRRLATKAGWDSARGRGWAWREARQGRMVARARNPTRPPG